MCALCWLRSHYSYGDVNPTHLFQKEKHLKARHSVSLEIYTELVGAQNPRSQKQFTWSGLSKAH
eukprot:gene1455-4614_t